MTRESMSKLDLLREQLDDVSVEKLEERASDLAGLSEEEQLDLAREAMPGETDLAVLRRMLQKVRGEKTDDEEGEDEESSAEEASKKTQKEGEPPADGTKAGADGNKKPGADATTEQTHETESEETETQETEESTEALDVDEVGADEESENGAGGPKGEKDGEEKGEKEAEGDAEGGGKAAAEGGPEGDGAGGGDAGTGGPEAGGGPPNEGGGSTSGPVTVYTGVSRPGAIPGGATEVQAAEGDPNAVMFRVPGALSQIPGMPVMGVADEGVAAVEAARRGKAQEQLATFTSDATAKKDELAGMKESLAPRLAGIEQQLNDKLEVEYRKTRARVKGAVSRARAKAEKDAQKQLATLKTDYDNAVSKIKADATQGRADVEAARKKQAEEAGNALATMQTDTAKAFDEAAEATRKVGQEKGKEAYELGKRRSDEYRRRSVPGMSRWQRIKNGGDFEKKKHAARYKAALDTGKQYQQEFQNKANEAATEIPKGKQQVLDGNIELVEGKAGQPGVKETIKLIAEGAKKTIDASEKSSLEGAKANYDGNKKRIEDALKTTEGSLDAVEETQLASAKSVYKSQKSTIKKNTKKTEQTLSGALDKAVLKLEELIKATTDAVSGVQFPDNTAVEQTLSENSARVSEVYNSVVSQTNTGISEHQKGLEDGLKTGASSFNDVAKAASTDANAHFKTFQSNAKAAVTDNKSKIAEIDQAHTGVTGKSQDAIKDIEAQVTTLKKNFTTVIGNIRTQCGGAASELGKDFQKTMGGLNSEITKQANTAASKVQPRWKAWAAFVIKVLITIIVCVAIILVAASGLGLLATIGLAMVIGAVGGIAKMCVDKWATGEEITWKDVGRAAAVGAIEGLVTLAGAGLANAATGAITAKVGEEVAKRVAFKAAMFVVDTAIGTTIDTLGAGVIKVTENLFDGKEVSWGVFWDAAGASFFTNLLGNAGGNLLAPYVGKGLAHLGIGQEVAENIGEELATGTTKGTTETVTRQVFAEASQETTELAAKNVIEQATQEVVEEGTEQVTKEVVEEGVEQVTKDMTEEVVEEGVEQVTKDATEEVVEEGVEQVSKEATEEVVAESTENVAKSVDAPAVKTDSAAPKVESTAPKVESTAPKAEATKSKPGTEIAASKGLPDAPDGYVYVRKGTDDVYLRRSAGNADDLRPIKVEDGKFADAQTNQKFETTQEVNDYNSVRKQAKDLRPEDPSSYIPVEKIDAHIDGFEEGASFLVPKNRLAEVRAEYGDAMIGRPDGQFVMRADEMDAIIKQSKGDIGAIEDALGIPKGDWQGEELVRIDIRGVDDANVRMPNGKEGGANPEWLPGGKLPTGYDEAVIDQVPKGKFTEADPFVKSEFFDTLDEAIPGLSRAEKDAAYHAIQSGQNRTVRPSVDNAKLQKFVNNNYRAQSKVGNGSTMDAARAELATGGKVFGADHVKKLDMEMRGLEKWLARHRDLLTKKGKPLHPNNYPDPMASAADIKAAEDMLKDMESAVAGN